jgi:hypothetical protein
VRVARHKAIKHINHRGIRRVQQLAMHDQSPVKCYNASHSRYLWLQLLYSVDTDKKQPNPSLACNLASLAYLGKGLLPMPESKQALRNRSHRETG